MQNQNPNDYLHQDEINLKKMFMILINSKKLIITITLVITTLGAIYSFQKLPEYQTSALIEIGNFLEVVNKKTGSIEKLTIEPLEILRQELNIRFLHKQKIEGYKHKNLKYANVEKRLLSIQYTSTLPEKNKEVINELVTYIENRHLNLQRNNTERIINKLTFQIQSLNDQIEYSKRISNEDEKLRITSEIKSLNDQIEYTTNKLLTQYENEKLRIASEIKSLNDQTKYTTNKLLTQYENEKLRIANEIKSLNDQTKYTTNKLLTQYENEKLRIANEIIIQKNKLPTVDLKIKALSRVILEDEKNLKLLESDPNLLLQRASQSPTLNQVLFSYRKQLIDYQNEIINISQEIYNLETQSNLLESNNLESDGNFKLSQKKDNLETQLKFLESNDLESDGNFKLSQKKDNLETQLKFLESNDLESEEIFKLSQKKDNLETQLKFFERVSLEKIFKLTQEKKYLEFELDSLIKQNPTRTQLIGEIGTEPENTIKQLIIFLSFMFGLFLSIIIIYIINSLKAFKEE